MGKLTIKKRKKVPSQKFIMRIDPQIDEAVDQALIIAEKGKIKEAEQLISELLKQHSDIHMVQYAMGVIYLMKGQYDQSIAYFDKAIELYPYFVEAWFNKGASHQKNLEIAEMIRAYQKVVELGDASQPFVHQAKTVINNLEQQIRKDKGLSLDGYLKNGDKFSEAFAAMENGEWEKAISGFQAVLAIDAKHTQSYGNLGICYARLGHKQEALAVLDKALELDPQYQPALLNRRIISSLNEGEKLDTDSKLASIDYYKDSVEKKSSLFEKLLGRFGL